MTWFSAHFSPVRSLPGPCRLPSEGVRMPVRCSKRGWGTCWDMGALVLGVIGGSAEDAFTVLASLLLDEAASSGLVVCNWYSLNWQRKKELWGQPVGTSGELHGFHTLHLPSRIYSWSCLRLHSTNDLRDLAFFQWPWSPHFSRVQFGNFTVW